MNSVVNWIEALNQLDMLVYWTVFLLIDFLVTYLLREKNFHERTLSFNFWLPFGMVVPLFWLLRLKEPVVIDVLLVGAMIAFYAFLRPAIYRKLRV